MKVQFLCENTVDPESSSREEGQRSDMASNAKTQSKETSSAESSSASASASVSASEVLDFLKRIDARLEKVENKLQKLDTLEKKVGQFESEIKSEMRKLWLHVDETSKKLNDKINRVDERIDNAEWQDGRQQSKINHLEEENTKLKDSVSYLQSQSMRNNLIFCNIPEQNNEKPAETEEILKKFLVEKLKIAQNQVDAMTIERAHRMGPLQNTGVSKMRKIVCKFNLFKDREFVKQKRAELRGTNYYIHEQFPAEIVEKRKRLVPHLKKARQENKTAWISYDTLYVEGRRVDIN